MREFTPSKYGPVLGPLVSGDRCRVLTNGRPEEAMRGALEAAARGTSQGGSPRGEMAQACVAALWLVHDFLDESHAVSQGIDSPTGAFWHGIMHRREGDYSNAKYWFRRVGRHDALGDIGATVVELGDELGHAELARQIAPAGDYDPMAMVDACLTAVRSRDEAATAFLRRVQQAEWESLFDYCHSGAEA